MMRPDELMDVEDKMVDPLTGEILDAAEGGKIKIDDLPKICRALRAIGRRRQLIEDYLAGEINRLQECCTQKDQPLADQFNRLSEIAEALLSQTGEQRLAYPGLGVVRFVAGREHLDTSGWDAMEEREQTFLYNDNQGAFRVVTKINPDKKEIAKRLKEGAESRTPLSTAFSIVKSPEKFEFKPEN